MEKKLLYSIYAYEDEIGVIIGYGKKSDDDETAFEIDEEDVIFKYDWPGEVILGTNFLYARETNVASSINEAVKGIITVIL